ncbi:unnamed protein product (macronuclear) [Paramecium tetraurelia]|uniref:DRBM domain-containing protein n=1 Tax=Paramecium tetraurelia TaxID=5888 RepID=A0DA68_PARTE|nr:uncharacterized protein GSPATT00014842001 [Paramecium tetraurelia]CAK79935.1 unnamed protein product [Paramecium tetraurelia]|eukprot:XP_001447332.1 hypothetical protein (macronuclear) [Paramecium tetraurelia strain d4-2]
MQKKLSKIKETFDKLKNYTYKFFVTSPEQGTNSEFSCKLFVNSLLISNGFGKNTKIARQQCADIGYDELMKKDWEFAEKNNFIVPKDDQYQILLTVIQRIKSEHQIQKDLEETIEQSDGYKQCHLEFDNLRSEGFSFIETNARKTSAYNLIQAIFQKYRNLQHCDNVNSQIQNYFGIQSGQIYQDSHKKVKIEYNDNIYQNTPMRTINNVQNNQQTQIQVIQHKIEIPEPAQMISEQLNVNQDKNQINENNTLSFQLAKLLQLNNESSFIFLMFIQQLSGFNFQITGSFISKSIRITKPELDIILEISDQHEIKFQKLLKELETEFRIQKENNIIILSHNSQSVQTRLKTQVPSLKIKLYCYYNYKQIDELHFQHSNEMNQYSQKYDQLYFSSLSLCLVHQWRDDNLEVLPKQLLDYLVVQTTNQFTYLNSPYQVLCQIIYLLKIGILDELSQRNQNEKELNPFLQSINSFYLELIHKLSSETLRQIKQIAEQWNKQQINIWVKKYI